MSDVPIPSETDLPTSSLRPDDGRTVRDLEVIVDADGCHLVAQDVPNPLAPFPTESAL